MKTEIGPPATTEEVKIVVKSLEKPQNRLTDSISKVKLICQVSKCVTINTLLFILAHLHKQGDIYFLFFFK